MAGGCLMRREYATSTTRGCDRQLATRCSRSANADDSPFHALKETFDVDRTVLRSNRSKDVKRTAPDNAGNRDVPARARRTGHIRPF